MSTIALDNRGGNHTLAQHVMPSDQVQCVRCGIWRKARPGKKLCVDCKTVEHHAARIQPDPIDGGTWNYRAGVWRWTPEPERMSAEDRAWCERAAGAGFWRQWEKANRGRSNPLQAEAMRRALLFPHPSADALLPESEERMFDRDTQSEGAVA